MNWEIADAIFWMIATLLWAINTFMLARQNKKTSEDIAMIKKILHHITKTGTVSVNDGPTMLMTEPQAKRFLTQLFDL